MWGRGLFPRGNSESSFGLRVIIRSPCHQPESESSAGSGEARVETRDPGGRSRDGAPFPPPTRPPFRMAGPPIERLSIGGCVPASARRCRSRHASGSGVLGEWRGGGGGGGGLLPTDPDLIIPAEIKPYSQPRSNPNLSRDCADGPGPGSHPSHQPAGGGGSNGGPLEARVGALLGDGVTEHSFFLSTRPPFRSFSCLGSLSCLLGRGPLAWFASIFPDGVAPPTAAAARLGAAEGPSESSVRGMPSDHSTRAAHGSSSACRPAGRAARSGVLGAKGLRPCAGSGPSAGRPFAARPALPAFAGNALTKNVWL